MRLTAWLAGGLLVVGATWIVNAPTLNYGFAYDDQAIILERPPMQEQGWQAFFGSRQWGVGRQLVLLSYDAQRNDEPRPRPFRVVNVLLACAVTATVFALAVDLGIGGRAALTAALLYAIHPTHTDAIVSIAGRAELLAALSVLACLLLHRRGYPGGAATRAVAALVFALGLSSKENAAVLLPILFLNDALLRPTDGKLDTRAYALSVLVLIVWAVANYANLGTLAPIAYVDNPLIDRTFVERIPLASAVLWRYLWLVFWPLGLKPDRSFAETDPSLTEGGFALVGWATVLALAWFSRRRWPRAAFAVLWFPAAFSVTANLAFPVGTIMAERLLYLPSVGPCLLAGLAAAWLAQRGALLRRATTVVTVLIVSMMAFLYDGRARVWASDEHYHVTTAVEAHRSAKAHYNLALLRARQGRYEEARIGFQRALAIYPAFSSAAYYLAGVLSEEGRLVRAAAVYRAYLRERPADVGALSQLIALQSRRGRVDQTRRLVRRMLTQAPGDTAYVELLRHLERQEAGVSP
jgi:tetratricopeptide (TPR) repeat protein